MQTEQLSRGRVQQSARVTNFRSSSAVFSKLLTPPQQPALQFDPQPLPPQHKPKWEEQYDRLAFNSLLTRRPQSLLETSTLSWDMELALHDSVLVSAHSTSRTNVEIG